MCVKYAVIMPRLSRVQQITKSPLTIKQKKFVKNYVDNNGNASKAYREAGYKGTPDTAKVEGSRLLANPHVKEELVSLLEGAGLNKVNVLEKLSKAIDAGLGQGARNSDSLRGINMLIKLHDMYPAERKRIEKVDVTLDLTNKNWEELKEVLANKLSEAKNIIEGEVVE